MSNKLIFVAMCCFQVFLKKAKLHIYPGPQYVFRANQESLKGLSDGNKQSDTEIVCERISKYNKIQL